MTGISAIKSNKNPSVNIEFYNKPHYRNLFMTTFDPMLNINKYINVDIFTTLILYVIGNSYRLIDVRYSTRRVMLCPTTAIIKY